MKQNKHIKVVVGVVLAGILIWGVYWGAGKFGSAMGCTDTLMHDIPSPDGRYIAHIFRRTCGPTIPDSIQANLQPAANAFDAMKFRPFVAIANVSDLDIHWDAPDQLTVKSPANGKVAFTHPQISGVKIKYE